MNESYCDSIIDILIKIKKKKFKIFNLNEKKNQFRESA
jgi:hypothetical protein